MTTEDTMRLYLLTQAAATLNVIEAMDEGSVNTIDIDCGFGHIWWNREMDTYHACLYNTGDHRDHN